MDAFFDPSSRKTAVLFINEMHKICRNFPSVQSNTSFENRLNNAKRKLASTTKFDKSNLVADFMVFQLYLTNNMRSMK